MIQNFTLLGITISFYDLFFAMGFVGVFTYLLSVCKKYKISYGKTAVFTVLVYGSSLIWMFFLYWADSGFKAWGGNNIVRIFWWLGVFTYPVARMLKIDYLRALDYVSPCLCINHGIAHIGCIFAGCCHGYPAVHGMYSVPAGCRCFPVQLCEALTALAIAALIVRMASRKKYSAEKCILYPTMLTLYGGTRFLWEFFADNKKVIGQISELALWALATCIIGLVWLLICKKRTPQGVN